MDNEKIYLKRKIYNKLLEWKRNSNGKSALLIEGARRVGKSTIVEEFAKNEYKSYILVDFNNVSKDILDLFINERKSVNFFFSKFNIIFSFKNIKYMISFFFFHYYS